ncbi:hypothetical protein ABW21_db0206176 [Orbilia brochopaga]|nr:hypothetical protein ABW21_db0206176 [Drechslerella brochopaga]
MVLSLIHADSNTNSPSMPPDINNLRDDVLIAREQTALKYLESEPSLKGDALENMAGRHATPETYPEKRERQAEWERSPLHSMSDVFAWWTRQRHDRAIITEEEEDGTQIADDGDAQDADDPPSTSLEEIELDDTYIPNQSVLDTDSTSQRYNRHPRSLDGKLKNGDFYNRQSKGKASKAVRRYETPKTPRRKHPASRNAASNSNCSDNSLQEYISSNGHISTADESGGARYHQRKSVGELALRDGVSDNVRRLLDLNPGWF